MELAEGGRPDHISAVPAPLPPYALAAPNFPFRHLAVLAGRAPIGGAREVALGCFLAARLAADRVGENDGDGPARAARAAGAKGWVGTLALPPAVRAPLQRCVESSASGSRGAVRRELTALMTAAAPFLDAGSWGELEALTTALGS